MQAKIALVGFTVLALLIGGCGGGGDETTISESDFISQGNTICAEAAKEQAAVYSKLIKESEEAGQPASADPSPEVTLVNAMSSSIGAMVDELRELGAPAGKEAPFEKMLDEYEAIAKKAADQPEGFLQTKGFYAPDKRAKALGLVKCQGM